MSIRVVGKPVLASPRVETGIEVSIRELQGACFGGMNQFGIVLDSLVDTRDVKVFSLLSRNLKSESFQRTDLGNESH